MIDSRDFQGLCLPGGFWIHSIRFATTPITDALGRTAAAQTTIRGVEFDLLIAGDLTEDELSVTLYHEILEAAAVAAAQPPTSVTEFNEGDFDQAAHVAHERWGPVTPANLNRLLQFHGFQGQ
jgi:hypothetical protein